MHGWPTGRIRSLMSDLLVRSWSYAMKCAVPLAPVGGTCSDERGGEVEAGRRSAGRLKAGLLQEKGEKVL